MPMKGKGSADYYSPVHILTMIKAVIQSTKQRYKNAEMKNNEVPQRKIMLKEEASRPVAHVKCE